MKVKKILKVLKLLSILLVIVLVVELGYYVYSLLKPSKSVYFDSLNDMEVINKGFIAVGSNNNNENYYEKAKITKYNKKKEKVFEKIYNKGFNSAFFGVCSDEDGYIAVGSYEYDEDEFDKSLRSALIVKYDTKGEMVFEDRFQVLGNSKFMDVVVVEDGYLVVGQSVYENMTLGFSNNGGAYVVKYDKSGKVIWKSNYGSNKTAIYNALVVNDNNIYVVGKDSNNIGLLTKYNIDGELIGNVNYEYSDNLGFTDITIIDGNIIVAGGKMIDEDHNQAVLVRYDQDLNFINDTIYEEEDNSRYNRILKDNNSEDLVLIGNTYYLDKNKENKEISILKYDGVIAKYKNDLKSIKVVKYDGERDAHFTDIVQDEDNYLVCGYSSYEDQSYMSKFIKYSDALKVLEVE